MDDKPLVDLDCAVRDIDERLPEIAQNVIRRHLDLTDSRNLDFLRRPDGREQHQSEWHQWGIITHTRMFLSQFDHEIPGYLRRWNLWDAVRGHLDRPVDGIRRWDLLRVSILLHDLGKFAVRTGGNKRFHFSRHEILSGHIIRRELELDRYGLTQVQIEYIARTAEDHFVLGHLRKRAREAGTYGAELAGTPAFRESVARIKSLHPDDYIEIGVLFLGDSLAKVDPTKGPERALSQHDTNIAIAGGYLEIAMRGHPQC